MSTISSMMIEKRLADVFNSAGGRKSNHGKFCQSYQPVVHKQDLLYYNIIDFDSENSVLNEVDLARIEKIKHDTHNKAIKKEWGESFVSKTKVDGLLFILNNESVLTTGAVVEISGPWSVYNKNQTLRNSSLLQAVFYLQFANDMSKMRIYELSGAHFLRTFILSPIFISRYRSSLKQASNTIKNLVEELNSFRENIQRLIGT
ncbi:uncharacterized protein EV154DRAFT_488935 [Mucor mucedo]|uniref:uncharacterized protein n=1 Tax=Mucor mucedo TaxID=29922 RepID=UPI002220D721|nr:uncharacterized protein EV154DRAFT_488935 [Mucor mucedo]KAI7864221.1 hypothetical protein EV154DRAFT_488935 [Mucor mucedo]